MKSQNWKYYCIKCSFGTNNKYDFSRHEESQKHKKYPIMKKFVCDICNKTYKYKSGLSKHKKKHEAESMKYDTANDEYNIKIDKKKGKRKKRSQNKKDENETIKKLEEKVFDLMTMCNDMKDVVIKTNDTVNKTLDDLVPKVGNTYNKMSINVYLNTHCKDAMNLTEFLENINISIDDLNFATEQGYTKGISNIFVRQLEGLKPTERPIHCCDDKKLQFYVKDRDTWKEDNDKKKIDKSISTIKMKHVKIIKEWEKQNPNYLQNDHLLAQWYKMVQELMRENSTNAEIRSRELILKEISDKINFEHVNKLTDQ